jgi:hypothetical protein
MLFLGFLECYGHSKPSRDLVAYHNRIDSIFADDRSVVVRSQVDPICIFTPLTHAEISDGALQKSYFFPRTLYADLKKHRLSDDLENQLKANGISLSLQEVLGKNYGVRMIFKSNDADQFDVIKNVDARTKTVRFDFVKKI